MRTLHHESAEQALIASALLKGDEVVARIELDESEFYNARHREIWRAMRALIATGRPSNDLSLLEAEMGERLVAVGGLAYLSELLNVDAVPDRAEYYAALIRQSHITRECRIALSKIIASEAEGMDMLTMAYEALSTVTSKHADDNTVDMPTAVREAAQEINERMERQAEGQPLWGLPTGFRELDVYLGGLQRGVVTVLAGRPSMGKSSVARAIADGMNAAGFGAHVFTPEDNRSAYAIRAISDHSRVSLAKIRQLNLLTGDLREVMRGASELFERKGWLIDDSSGMSSAQVALRVRKHKAKINTALVVVDYLQLLREPNARSPIEEVDRVMRGLVDLARSENVAVLALSQLSRKCEERPLSDRKPLLSDLRESGTIEQVADSVIMVYRHEFYEPDNDNTKGLVELLIRKNKHGETGGLTFKWDAECASIRPLSRRDG